MHLSPQAELIDDETLRRAEISKRLLKCAGEIPPLLDRLTEVMELPNLTELQVLAVESFTERIGSLNKTIGRTVNAENVPLNYEESLANTDRLREEIGNANLLLDRLLLDPRGN
jgi:hypothetical protein